jgi:hypothetical protein
MLTFDESDHTYRIGKKRVWSVTQILVAGGAIDTTWFTPESAERGRRVHDAIHAFCENPDLGDMASNEVAPYLSAYREFISVTDAEVIQTEGMIYCASRGYTGRYDQYIKIKDQYVLIDLKTGPIQPWCAMQTAAYAFALIEAGRKVDKRMGVHLDKSGHYKIETYQNLRSDFARFVTCFLMAQRSGLLQGD